MIKKVYILSGGKSSRMGEDKGLILLNTKPVIEYLLEGLKRIPELEIKIIAHHPEYQKFGFPVISDIYADKGPLDGIFTALKDANETSAVISADTPFISRNNLLNLLQNSKENQINVLEEDGKIYPLCAIYPIVLINKIEERIKNDQLKLFDFLNVNLLHKISVELSTIERLNINTPEDILTAEKLLKNEN